MRRVDFESAVDRVIESLPRWVVDSIDNLVVVVEETPPPELDGALGVYEGVSLADRGEYSGSLPDRIVIFRQPHLAMRLSEGDLAGEIRKTVLHEIGHHLGIDDARLEELGWD